MEIAHAYSIPFDQDSQERIDQTRDHHRADEPLRCRSCGQSYYVLISNTTARADADVIHDLGDRLGACGRHPKEITLEA